MLHRITDYVMPTGTIPQCSNNFQQLEQSLISCSTYMYCNAYTRLVY